MNRECKESTEILETGGVWRGSYISGGGEGHFNITLSGRVGVAQYAFQQDKHYVWTDYIPTIVSQCWTKLYQLYWLQEVQSRYIQLYGKISVSQCDYQNTCKNSRGKNLQVEMSRK